MATYYAIAAGGNVETAGTWSTVAAKDASRVGQALVPGAADTCIVDDWSGNITVSGTTFSILNLDFVTNGAYTRTATFTAAKTLTINTAGSVKFSSTMTITGTGSLILNGNISITFNGKTFSGALVFGTTGTKTLVDNGTVTGLVSTTGVTTLDMTSSGFGDVLTCAGGFSAGSSMRISGTTTLRITGGSLNANTQAGFIANNVTIDGNITLSPVYYKTGTLKYTSGVVSGSNLLNIIGNCTLDLNGMTIYGISNSTAASVVTLLSNLAVGTGGISIFIFSLTFTGAFNVTTVNFYLDAYTSFAPAFTYQAGTTLTITGVIRITGGSAANMVVKSSVASSPAYLVFSGNESGCILALVTFTDIDASGSTISLFDWLGSITRCSNIFVKNYSSIQNIFGIA